eukprot:COSAG03_NODE_17147_length_383_cov_0.711268_1_plen_87_part_01
MHILYIVLQVHRQERRLQGRDWTRCSRDTETLHCLWGARVGICHPSSVPLVVLAHTNCGVVRAVLVSRLLGTIRLMEATTAYAMQTS